MDKWRSTFTGNLRAAREAAGLSQEQAAIAAGLFQSHYSRIETGQADPTISTLLKIAASLDVTAAELLHDVAS